jgi:hypothetical protein
LNAIEPINLSGATDNFGEHEPWVEIYNAGSAPVSLDGAYLTDTFTNLTRWAFPAGTTLGGGQYLVSWLDGQTAQSIPGALHGSFRIAAESDSLALVYPINSQLAVLDYLNYSAIPADHSYGFSSGQDERTILNFPTPATQNNNATGLSPLINEWMASNTKTLLDPSIGHFDDWLELYNPNPIALDLTGYTLLGSLNGSHWPLPAGTQIGAHRFLFVWADGGATPSQPGELHAIFKLSKGGDSIVLFAPNSLAVNSVRFMSQTNDVTQGRFPDGSNELIFMSTPTPGFSNRAQTASKMTAVLIGGEVVLAWNSEAGKNYVLEYKTTLRQPPGCASTK